MPTTEDILLGALRENLPVVELPLEELQINPILLIVVEGEQPVRVFHFETQRVGQQVFAINPVMAEKRARTQLLLAIASIEGAVRRQPGGRSTQRRAIRAARRRLRIPDEVNVEAELHQLNSGHPPLSRELALATAAKIHPGKLP
jgi:hypothetical protein